MAHKTNGYAIGHYHNGASLDGRRVVRMQREEMVRRVETGAGVGLLRYEITTVLVTAQEQHWLTMRYGRAFPRRHVQTLNTDGKQRRAGADIEAFKLSGEGAPARHLNRQRNDLLHEVKHSEHSAIGDNQALLIPSAAADKLDPHAHHGVLPSFDGRR